jgi:hypothetical protein
MSVSDELSKIIGFMVATIMILAFLPMMTATLETVNVSGPAEPFSFTMPEIKNPLHKGIIDNMITGILFGGLILVAALVVYLLRFLYGVVREGAYIEEDDML